MFFFIYTNYKSNLFKKIHTNKKIEIPVLLSTCTFTSFEISQRIFTLKTIFKQELQLNRTIYI